MLATYDQRCLILDLGLRGTCIWIFLDADFRRLIVDADFLTHFQLAVGLSEDHLVGFVTKRQTTETPAGHIFTIQIILPALLAPFEELLRHLPSVVQATNQVQHHTLTLVNPFPTDHFIFYKCSLLLPSKVEHISVHGNSRLSATHSRTSSRRKLLGIGDHVSITER